MRSIGLDSAIAMSEHSKRTCWRRVSANIVGRTGSDRGRTMVALDDVLPFISIPLHHEDIDLIVSADNGDADAQNDLAQVFDEFGKRDVALYWWREPPIKGIRMRCTTSVIASSPVRVCLKTRTRESCESPRPHL